MREISGDSEGGWPTSPLHHCTARPQKKPRRSGTKFLATGLPKMRVNGNPRATIAWLGLAGRIVPAVNGVGVVGHGAILPDSRQRPEIPPSCDGHHSGASQGELIHTQN